MSQQIGFAAESEARQYLVKQGLRWITSNYRSRWGEVDLIMWHGDYLVFVEVRARVSSEYGGALESITYHKKQKIIKTATHYLMIKCLMEKHPLRFDVICVQGKSAEMLWVKNAFGVDF